MAEVIRVGTGGSIVVETEVNDSINPPTTKLLKETASGVLPEVTAEDNGKVLSVIEGEWAKGALPIMDNIAELEEAPTADDFNGLLSALITAGYMKAPEEADPPEVTE